MRALALIACAVVVLVLTVPARGATPHPCIGPPVNVTTGAGGCGADPPPRHVKRSCGFSRLLFPAWRAGPHLCTVKPLRHFWP